MGSHDRSVSWAATETEVDERRAEADHLVGLELASVRYFDLDYRRSDLAPTAVGARLIENPVEWIEPSWRSDDCDTLDYGVELTTTNDRTFAITWDPPGKLEGLNISESPLTGSAIHPDAEVAVWSVGGTSGWEPLVGRRVSAVELHYLPWADDGFWCPRITLSFNAHSVVFLLGQGSPDGPIQPSANNVAVLFDPTALPGWNQTT